ncbi:MAG: AMP-binding protein, partial [Dermatophilaceae bacterium]
MTTHTGATHLLAPVLARAEAADTAYRVAIRQWGRRRRGQTRVTDEVTYRALADRIDATARGLTADGLNPGDRALFSVRPRAAGVVLALGVVHAGGTVVFVDPGSTPALFAARVAAARPTHAITEALLYAVSRGPLRRLTRSRGLLLPDYASLPLRHVYAGRWLPGVPRGARSARSLSPSRDDAPDRSGLIGLDADAAAWPALVVFTSGTTAAPKAVVHTPASLHAGCDLLRGVFELEPGDIVHT